MLTQGENIEDFKEVTPAQRTAIELQDASFIEPPKAFIDLWNEACGIWGSYNEQTGYFELNGLTDITYEQAMAIYNAGAATNKMESRYRGNTKIRTTLPISINNEADAVNLGGMFQGCSNIEVINIIFSGHWISKLRYSFSCNKVHTIGILNLQNTLSSDTTSAFYCPKLVNLKMYVSGALINDVTLNLSASPLISLESFQYLVDKTSAQTKKTFTLIVHRNIYAKLTSDETNDVYNNLTDEEKVQWAAVLSLAISKNIQFATT